ncbi:cytochrome P450 [Venturia nashicola]|uniref:Cytochrome P450 n=1 Tax=Venturia nashicola TaxID=86259 RepID=A0A4Z1PCQ6_9PEZI|nr:cytochrome P450 [Venturia nashicola]
MASQTSESPLAALFDRLSSASASTILLTSIAVITAYQLWSLIYNSFFHPLHSFPGPRFAAVSKIPLTISQFKGTPHKWNHELHLKYGPVVRFAPNMLSFIDERAWKDIYGFKKPGPYKDQFYGNPPNGVPGLLSETRDDEHARMRKIFSGAFSDRAIKEQEPMFLQYIDLLVEKLKILIKENPDNGIDMVRMLNFTTFDIMGDLTFGAPLGLLEKSEYTPWVALIFKVLKFRTYLRGLKSFFVFSIIIDFLGSNALGGKRKSHFNYAAEQVDKRLQIKTERPDIWGLVLRQAELGRGLSLKAMHSNAALFMGAGTETTATELSGLLYLLLSNPQKMAKLSGALRSTFQHDDDITMERLSQIPYIHACIEEGLRLYPPVPIGLPRRVPTGGSTICDDLIPTNTEVCVTQYSAYHSPTNFYRPDSFEPERWVQPIPQEFVNDHRGACQPFSIGSRNCIGQNMAMHEMRLILAKIIYNFDFELLPESQQWADQRVFTLWEKKPLMVKLKVAQR